MRDVDGEPLGLQSEPQAISEPALVLDDQHAHDRASSPTGRS
jgi:hypothetical protein